MSQPWQLPNVNGRRRPAASRLERIQRHEKRRKNIRRGVIVAIVAVARGRPRRLPLLRIKKPRPRPRRPRVERQHDDHDHDCPTCAISQAPVQRQCRRLRLSHVDRDAGEHHCRGRPRRTLHHQQGRQVLRQPDTTAGTFVVALDAKTAPVTTNNFVFLAEHNFYKCVIFHRVISGFVVQSGDPTGTGTGGPAIPCRRVPQGRESDVPAVLVAMAQRGLAAHRWQSVLHRHRRGGETLPTTYSLFGQVSVA